MTRLGLWILTACSGEEPTPRRRGPELDPSATARAAQGTAHPPGCAPEPRSGAETADAPSRSESRAWARPDRAAPVPCSPGQGTAAVVPVTDTGSAPTSASPEPITSVAKTRIPLTSGLVFQAVYRHPAGDRADVVQVTDASADGVMYRWQFIQHPESGPPYEDSWERFVRSTDLESSPRLNTYFAGQGRSDAPGYTTFTISRATYARVKAEGSAPYRIVMIQGGPFQGVLDDIVEGGPLEGQLADAFRSRVTVKGTLSVVSPDPVSILLNGTRVSVPALHLKGRFSYQDAHREDDFWVLADSSHPLLLRFYAPPDTFQIVSIQVPEGSTETTVERRLETDCRVELPGVYFGFASAEMQSASNPALIVVAGILGRNPDWSFAIEGHTDSIGDPAANQSLSQRRAEAVKAKLVSLHHISPDRLRPLGFGSTRPRETNATIEGRARNRRVELVRAC